MTIGAVRSTNLAYVRLGLRGLQLFCSLLAMSFAAAGFYGGGSTRSSTFVLLMGYTGMLYTLWYIVAVEVLHLANRPALRLEQGTDALLTLMLLIAGICLAASDYTSNCGYGWHCNNLRAATAFDFIAMFFFLVSLGLTFVAGGESSLGHSNVQVEEPVPYHQNATPTGALSPIGHLNDGPASKV
ncbi:uncharacterized protein PITG_12886 [Phytophthora infestans T30-4]|uniref:MARVEL domain-containing protein n=2 Tax=Phytophthora infestans TaxID=4787 RepID=D0NLE1_PHYIT|nr:uncharacterized protein PITG_12886 [Phytophthora infestans T30-4]EEY60459.1 conserved hypothetical protein [Phytophthora infestans T30-4]KAF4039768.1 Membrane-associating domain-containing protein [Phytophthora infestans]KAF4133005.1 Membrane-associating domain-containing protein [Phytophthora infestans]KAI9984048.1 hypothetical protein PInf_005338 [Phytophthora infestans]|eukprot:XP_002900255.1 conserved hypothetical protein [Phytophthora infestans T30-4]